MVANADIDLKQYNKRTVSLFDKLYSRGDMKKKFMEIQWAGALQ